CVVAPSAQFPPQLVSAANTRRISVLVAIDQQDVAIMQAEGAKTLFLAKQPFADIPKPASDHCLVRESRFHLPAKLHGQPTPICWQRRWPSTRSGFRRPR